jgi:cation diffusion facilitator CzcD-associated flavoprotein CzcO
MSWHVERPYHVAIIGSGQSGFLAAASPLKTADASNSR